MAISYVKKTPTSTLATRNTSAGTAITTPAFASDVSVGNIVIAVACQYRTGGSAEQPTFSDSAGNTWYIDSDISDVGVYQRTTVAHCYPSSAAAITVTITTSSSSYKNLGAYEFSGVVTGLTAGASAHTEQYGTSTTDPTSGSISPSGTCLYLGLVNCSSNTTITEDDGWTLLHEDESFTAAMISSIYQITSGSQAAGWTFGTSRSYTAGVVAYVEAAGGTTGNPYYYFMNQ
jgi:hypothetical protein